MKMSIDDLGHEVNALLEALERGELVTVLYRGRVKGTIIPHAQTEVKVEDHPFFGSQRKPIESVKDDMNHLRRSRTKRF